jgi:serine protease inhibitor
MLRNIHFILESIIISVGMKNIADGTTKTEIREMMFYHLDKWKLKVAETSTNKEKKKRRYPYEYILTYPGKGNSAIHSPNNCKCYAEWSNSQS